MGSGVSFRIQSDWKSRMKSKLSTWFYKKCKVIILKVTDKKKFTWQIMMDILSDFLQLFTLKNFALLVISCFNICMAQRKRQRGHNFYNVIEHPLWISELGISKVFVVSPPEPTNSKEKMSREHVVVLAFITESWNNF